ncbi:MAG TPA: hypothetical protein DCZ94_02220 [Lentisphaeria bacterium]|nr:hypothetical protein [Lentisphaeria bacterium]
MAILNEKNIIIFLVEIFILLGLSKFFGEILRRRGQPAIVAEILVGVILGPSILGRYCPELHNLIFPNNDIQKSMLETVAWIGILFFLLDTGLELDFSSAWRQRSDALIIAITGLIVPMAIAFVPCLYIPDEYLRDPDKKIMFALFVSAVMTVSALPVTARVMRNFNLYKTDLGFLIMSALTVNDILGWVAFTLILGFFMQSQVNFMDAAVIILATTGFTFFCLSYGRTFADKIVSSIQKAKLPEPSSSLTFIVLLGLVCGALTSMIGINALFGFFIAGIMAGEARSLSEKTRQVISQMVFSIFVPLFFATIGLNIDVLKNFNWMLAGFVFVIGVLGRFAGAWLGVMFTKQPRSNFLMISLSHVAGGEMQIVVSMFAFHHNLISETVFVSIIFGTIASSVALGPLFAWALKLRKQISLLELFSRDNIMPDLQMTEKDSALVSLCSNGASAIQMNEKDLYEIVKKREDDMSTGLEEGIAVPHARLTNITKPVIVFGRSKHGIEWNSPDGKPATHIFLILTPLTHEDSQVQILRNIVRGFRKDENRRKIMSAADNREILDIFKDIFKDAQLKN